VVWHVGLFIAYIFKILYIVIIISLASVFMITYFWLCEMLFFTVLFFNKDLTRFNCLY